MLRLAGQAGIATPQHILIEVAGKAVMLSSRDTENSGYCRQHPPANVVPLDKVIDGMKTHCANVKTYHERGDHAKWL